MHQEPAGRRSSVAEASSMVARVVEWKKKAGAVFWKIADRKIPNEWLVFILGGAVLLAYVFVLFFGTRPRK